MSTTSVSFIVYCKPEPQGSKNAFVIPGTNRAVVVDQGAKKLKPYRQEIVRTAMTEIPLRPWAGKHVPVILKLNFQLLKPPSIGKKRTCPVVKPDIDKLCRSTLDALTGVLYVDDAQIVELHVRKEYSAVECVTISAAVADVIGVSPSGLFEEMADDMARKGRLI